MKYVASSAGSLMLFGEHAVLHGKQAVCCAVNQRVSVTLTPRTDNLIRLHSALGHAEMSLTEFSIAAPFQFVATAIVCFLQRIPAGFDLEVKADFSATMGLGSSAAVTVATLGVLAAWLGDTLSLQALFLLAKTVVLQVQGLGSGADVAAAVFGGIVAYCAEPLAIQPFAFTPDIVLVYSGAKVPTREVVQWVTQRQQENPEQYAKIYDAIDVCTKAAIVAIQKQAWDEVGAYMQQHQRLHAALGVSTPLLDELVAVLDQQPEILGAKISGSGLGDCVVGLGKMADNIFPANAAQEKSGVKSIPVKISTLGFQYE